MVNIERAKTYTILPGQNNFRPLENPLPRACSGFDMAIRFDKSCWWSQEDWEGDQDRRDWNKAKMISWFFSFNDCHSAGFAWRPADEEFVFDLTAYTNPKCGEWMTTGAPVKIYAGEMAYTRCRAGKRIVEYEIEYYGNVSKYSHSWKRPWPWLCREVGTSIGGANNSPGPYGGKATQAMKMEIDFQLV